MDASRLSIVSSPALCANPVADAGAWNPWSTRAHARRISIFDALAPTLPATPSRSGAHLRRKRDRFRAGRCCGSDQATYSDVANGIHDSSAWLADCDRYGGLLCTGGQDPATPRVDD